MIVKRGLIALSIILSLSPTGGALHLDEINSAEPSRFYSRILETIPVGKKVIITAGEHVHKGFILEKSEWYVALKNSVIGVGESQSGLWDIVYIHVDHITSLGYHYN